MGKKKACRAEVDAKLIKSVMSEVVVKQEQSNSYSADTISSFDGGGGNIHSLLTHRAGRLLPRNRWH